MVKKAAISALAVALILMSFAGCGTPKPVSVQIGYNALDGKAQILETAEQAIEEQDLSEAQNAGESTDIQSAEETVQDESIGQNTEEASDEQKPELCYDNPVSIPKNSVVQLTATLQPEGNEAEVTWSSDNESLASVDQSGKLTLYNEEGAATIIAKTDNGLEAILTVDITKTEEELANEEIAKALAEIASAAMTEEEALAKAEESKYGALSESEKQAIAPAVDRLKTAVQQKQKSKQQTAPSGNQNTNNNASPGTASNNNGGGNTNGGLASGNSGGNTGGGSPAPAPSPAPTPQPAEKYYPTMTPAEMESYAKSYAESIGLVYDPNANKDTWSWSAPSSTVPGESTDSVKGMIAGKIDNAQRHGAKYVRCYVEMTGNKDSAGNPEYRIYILMG